MTTTDLILGRAGTPWGVAQTVSVLLNGCFVVHTAGHGGIYVPDELLNQIPKEEREFAKMWSGSENWYEEDCCSLSPMYHLDGGHMAYPGNTREKVSEYWKALATRKGWVKPTEEEKAKTRMEIAEKARRPISGTVGDMTAVLPGFEDFVKDDVPLFGVKN